MIFQENMDDRGIRNHQPLGVSSPISPYLNIDRSIFKREPQYIMPEGASPHRGRFEMAFSQIGGCVITGAGFGGVQGLYFSFKDKQMISQQWAARRTHLLNAFTKYGSAAAGSLGLLAVIYSGFGAVLSQARGVDDELNTLASGTLTGLLFRSVHGWQKCGIGGLVGFTLAGAYCLLMKQDIVERTATRIMPGRW